MIGQNTPQDAPHAPVSDFPCCEALRGGSDRDDAAQARDEFRDRGVIIADLIRERDDALTEVQRLREALASVRFEDARAVVAPAPAADAAPDSDTDSEEGK